jgi:hypothetical protein
MALHCRSIFCLDIVPNNIIFTLVTNIQVQICMNDEVHPHRDCNIGRGVELLSICDRSRSYLSVIEFELIVIIQVKI